MGFGGGRETENEWGVEESFTEMTRKGVKKGII